MLENYDSGEIVNVGSGSDISIKDLAALIAEITGYSGEIKWDSTKPDGMLKKCMDVSRMVGLGFTPRISLEEGIKRMVKEYRGLKADGMINSDGGAG